MKEAMKQIRRTILEIIHDSGAAHLGSSLSAVEILSAVFRSVDLEKIRREDNARDRIILSKGHGAAALYAVMHHYGLLTDAQIRSYFQNGSLLAGHASHFTPYVEHSTGALGHGLPVALGAAIGLRSRKINSTVFVIVGDGELHEGSNWEALMLAGHLGMNNLCVLVDNNKMSQIAETAKCCDIEPLKAKFESFNFRAFEVDGHDEDAIWRHLRAAQELDRPTAIICHTTKGKGVSFMENVNLWHYRCPQGKDYDQARAELEAGL